MEYNISQKSLEAFWAKVEKGDGCWEWRGHVDTRPRYGYGAFSWTDTISKRGRTTGPHRLAYSLLVGNIPEGLQIDHLCRNRTCVNPSHLEPVTPKVNTLRGVGPAAINSKKTHCGQGHEITATVVAKDRIFRECSICKVARNKSDWEKRKAKMIASGVKTGIPTKLRTHCPYGHQYDGFEKTGMRKCMECQRRRSKEKRARAVVARNSVADHSE